jgi:hypothetical protein
MDIIDARKVIYIISIKMFNTKIFFFRIVDEMKKRTYGFRLYIQIIDDTYEQDGFGTAKINKLSL